MGTTNFQLDDLALQIKLKNYKPCRMKDELIGLKARNNECGIVNLNDSTISEKDNKKYGHWVSYCKRDGKSYFFCSYGSPPPVEIIDYLGKPILTHNFQIQPFGSTICGELSIQFLHFIMNNGLNYTDIILDMFEMYSSSSSDS